MTLLTEKGTFTKTTSTSTPVSQQVNLVDSSLTPKIIILWTAGQTTSNGTYTDHMLWSYGWSDGTNDVCQAMRSHETNENEVYVMRNDAIISIMSLTAGSEVARADVSAVAAGSFTLNWSVQSDTSAMVIHYQVIGGTDITNVSAFTGTHQNFNTGNHSWNGSGTTFTPDFGLIMNSSDSGVTVNTITASTDFAKFNLGAAKSTTEQWSLTAKDETAATSNPMMYLNSGRCMATFGATTLVIAYEGTFVSFNSAAGGGITLNITNAAGNTAVLGFLLIKGGNWDCDVFQQRSGTGTQDITFTDNTVVPKLVTLVGINSATLGSPLSNHYVCVGASDGTNEGNCWNGNTDALATWVTARSTDTGKAYRQATPAATATSSTTNAECDMIDMDTAGQFTLDWTTADTTLRQMAYWMVGEVAAAGTQFNRTASDTITIADASTTRTVSALRVPSTDSSTVSDSSLTRMLSATRAPGADTATVVDSSLTRSKTLPGVPSTDSSTITDSSLARRLSATRAPSTDTLTTGESSTRMLSAVRLPTSDSTTVADVSITQAKAYTRTPSDTTAVSDFSLTRLLSAIRVPSQDTVTVTAGTSTRMLSAIRVPSTDSVATTEQSIGGKVYGRIPSTDTVTIVDSALTRLLSLTRNPSDTTGISENLIRILSAFRVTAPDTTTVADVSTLRIRSLTRVPSTDTATVVDSSLVRMLQALRVVTAETTTINENLTATASGTVARSVSDTVAAIDGTLNRFLSAVRVPSLDTVSILDSSLVRMLSASRTPSQDTITVADSSIIRRLQLVRTVSTDTIALSESISRALTTAGVFSRTASDTVTVTDSALVRLLSSTRTASDTTPLSESLARSVSRIRSTATDTISIADVSITRVRSLSRLPTQDTMNIVEASLIRLLRLARSANDIVAITEVQNAITHSRALTETVNVTEPLLQRIVRASRSLNDIVNISEAVFYQTYHKYVFDTVVVSEQLFSIRQALSGAVTYATPDEVRPLLGNIGPTQRTDAQINLAIDAAYDEINTKTNRIPPNEWKDTDHNFGIVKKLARYIAAKEMAIGIKDFDTKPLEMEIDHLFNDLLTYDTSSDATQDIVGSSEDTTFALNEAGIIWSVRYKNLRKSAGSENSTTINPDT